MTLNAAAGAEFLRSLVAGLTGVAGAQIGVPETVGNKVYGFVTAGRYNLFVQTEGSIKRDQSYTITLAYRVGKDEVIAEITLMNALDELITLLKPGEDQGDAGRIMSIDTNMADMPEYNARAGQEFREFPIIVTLRQEHIFT